MDLANIFCVDLIYRDFNSSAVIGPTSENKNILQSHRFKRILMNRKVNFRFHQQTLAYQLCYVRPKLPRVTNYQFFFGDTKRKCFGQQI